MASEAVFKNISAGGKLSGPRGIFKITPTLIFWKTENRNDPINPKDLSKAYWLGVSHDAFQLKLETTTKASLKFDGFKESDFDQVKAILNDNFQLELQPVEVSTKGENHGEVEAEAFTIDGKHSFEIPYTEIAGSKMTNAAKNDVVVEINQDEGALEDDDEQVMEIRFFITNTNHDGTAADITPEKLHELLRQKTAINNSTGAAFCRFSAVRLLTPRGSYDIELLPNFMRFHGKTHDYKIRYEQITRLFQLPKSEKDVFFIVSLEPPIRQGGQRYHHVVMQFERKQKTTMTITLPTEVEERFKDLPREFNDEETNIVVNQVFNAVTKQKVTFPSSFRSHSGAHAIRCSCKAIEGYLYPLAKSLFFLPNKPVYIRFSEIAHVQFARAGNASSNRTFDFVVGLRDGESHTFVGVQKSEYEGLFDFIRAKNIRVESPDDEDGGGAGPVKMAVEEENSSEDEDFNGEEGPDDDFKSDEESSEGEEEEESEGEEEEPAEKPKKSEKSKEKGKEKEKGKDKGKEKVKEKEKSNGKSNGASAPPKKKHKTESS